GALEGRLHLREALEDERRHVLDGRTRRQRRAEETLQGAHGLGARLAGGVDVRERALEAFGADAHGTHKLVEVPKATKCVPKHPPCFDGLGHPSDRAPRGGRGAARHGYLSNIMSRQAWSTPAKK